MKIKKLLALAPLLLTVYAGSAQAMVINFNHAANMDAQALAGFQAAAQRWENVLHDDVQVNIGIDFMALGAGILGSTNSSKDWETYTDVRNALQQDARGMNDLNATAGLSQNACLSVMMNGTATNPNGAGSHTAFVDNNCDDNNEYIYMTTANAKALGLINPFATASDASISFSSAFSWDFDPSNGVDGNAFDFIGVATHEIGHALGFVSGVDVLDRNLTGPYPEGAFAYVTPADLYRCTPESRAAGANLDWSADKRDKFFSLDNCQTQIARFSTGVTWGDGRQASHWKDNEHLGILDPTAGRGELLSISMLDLQMYDVIGWNVVPEPASLALMLFGMAGLFAARRRQQ